MPYFILKKGFDLNNIISNGKRFMAYEIINQLQKSGNTGMLEKWSNLLIEKEKRRRGNCIKGSTILLMPKQL
jgi:hypothetical protein